MLLKSFVVLTALLLAQVVLAETIEVIDKLHQEGKGFADYKKIENLIQRNIKQESDALLWRLARTFSKLGKYTVDNSEKKKYFSVCQKYAEQAINLNIKLAEGYYFKALCMGKLGQLNGILNSMFMISSFKENMEKAAELDPSVEHGGAHRALGKFYIELPFLFGQDLKKSIAHLKLAIQYGPAFADNYLFLAESYSADDNLEAARSTIQDFLNRIKGFPGGSDLERKRSQARELLKKY